MSVRWPDGDVTGSVHVDEAAPIPVVPEPDESNEDQKSSDKKEVKDGAR